MQRVRREPRRGLLLEEAVVKLPFSITSQFNCRGVGRHFGSLPLPEQVVLVRSVRSNLLRPLEAGA